MKKTKATKRLTISSEKIRSLTGKVLTAAELAKAGGGMTPSFGGACETVHGCNCNCSSEAC